jgi:cell division septum initiation protein DivIVA
MQITINNVDVQNKGKYQLAVVEYNTADGKTEKKNVVSFTNKALYSTLSTAKQGDVFDVKLGKNDKGYWEFQEATKSQGGQASSFSKASASPKSTYETPEERAARQVYIIRQSSLSTAAAILTVGAKSVQVDDVIKTAKQLEAYVFGKDQAQSEFVDMPEDIPTIE